MDASQSKGLNYLQYQTEYLDTNGNLNRLTTQQDLNRGIGKTKLDDYLSYHISPPFLPANANVDYYRIVLYGSQYQQCAYPVDFSTDTCYIKIRNCHANAYFKLDGDTGYSYLNPFDWRIKDSIEVEPKLNGATKAQYEVQRINSTGVATGQNVKWSQGFSGRNSTFNLQDIYKWYTDVCKVTGDTNWFSQPTKFEMSMKYSNAEHGGCDSSKKFKMYFQINTCHPITDVKLIYKNRIVAEDTLWIDEGDTAFYDPIYCRGINFFNYKLHGWSVKDTSLQDGGEIIGQIFNKNKSDVNILHFSNIGYTVPSGPCLTAINNDSTIYKLEFQGYSSLSCIGTTKTLFIGIRPSPLPSITLKGITWPNGQIHYFCDTTNFLPLAINSKKAASWTILTLGEIEPSARPNRSYYIYKSRFDPTAFNEDVQNLKDIGRYDYKWTRIFRFPQNLNIEANEISKIFRMYNLNKDRIWRMEGRYFVFPDTIDFNFSFGFTECQSAPPEQVAPKLELPVNSEDRGSNEYKSCRAFPIPTDRKMSIVCNFELNFIEILNIYGKLCLKPSVQFENGNLTMNLQSLASGIYLLKAIGLNKEIYYIKIVKQ